MKHPMLLSLKIENFALIDSLNLELDRGLNVLTGETGAGKSIILDALNAAMGGKVPGRVVRSGAKSASIVATFQTPDSLKPWLLEQGLGVQDQLICSREIHGDKRSRCRLNGVAVTQKVMLALQERLVDITAQGQTVQLGDPNLQRDWLDSFGGESLIQQRSIVLEAHHQRQQAHQHWQDRHRSHQDYVQKLDLFRYQLQELEQAALTHGDELDELLKEQQRLTHGVELQHQSYQVYQALYQDDRGGQAAADRLGEAEQLLREMCRYDDRLQGILDLVTTALAQVEEAGREINAYGDDLETDPQRLEDVHDRITLLKTICRKYGPSLGEALHRYQHLQQQVRAQEDHDQSLEALEAAYQKAQAHLVQACNLLTQYRQAAAQRLETTLVQELKPLAMEKVQFQVQLAPSPPTAQGADHITFLFGPNPGEPLQPLGTIASGGEMSRFLLALKACFSQVDPVGTLIFDEIDVGVSGRVSQAIAQKLRQLSQVHQVLCVTHQPLIAAQADRHFKVSKDLSQDDRTQVTVQVLDNPQSRSQELAELAGGESADEALTFAQSLLKQADLEPSRQANPSHPIGSEGTGVTPSKPHRRPSVGSPGRNAKGRKPKP